MGAPVQLTKADILHLFELLNAVLCRIVARSNDNLHDILQSIVAIKTVVRSQTHLALSTQLQRSVADLIAHPVSPSLVARPDGRSS